MQGSFKDELLGGLRYSVIEAPFVHLDWLLFIRQFSLERLNDALPCRIFWREWRVKPSSAF